MPLIHSLHWAPPEWLSWLERAVTISVELSLFEKLFNFLQQSVPIWGRQALLGVHPVRWLVVRGPVRRSCACVRGVCQRAREPAVAQHLGVEVIPILEVSLPTVVEVWAQYVVSITL